MIGKELGKSIAMYRLDTLLAQAGCRWDERTGAISMPLYHSSTFRHPGLGKSTGFDYSRTSNPTRSVLESSIALVEGGEGSRAFGFSSGLAAIDSAMRLLEPGSTVLATEDLYGGTYRLLQKVCNFYGLSARFVDTSDEHAVRAALGDKSVKTLFIETPSNPLLKIADIAALSAIAHEKGAMVIVDNTFLTFCRQRPLDLGADIVLYSATKYLCGHDDIIAGVAVSRNSALCDKLAFIQNAAGAILGASDAWLLLRGLKTLSLRMRKHEENAVRTAEWLKTHDKVGKVYYPGLPSHSGHERLKKQSSGFGGMLSFEVNDECTVPKILSSVKVFMFAESLGGVSSLITYPAVQTHADIAEAERERLGVNRRLLRLSVGIEDFEDLRDDLEEALG